MIDKGFGAGFNYCLMYLAKVNILHEEKDQSVIPGFNARTPEFCLTMLCSARETLSFRDEEIYCLFKKCGRFFIAYSVYKQ